MIASLLPGLRDLRTPLATGYLWLLALWLLLEDRLPKSEGAASGPIKSLFELGGLLGSTALLAVVSFVAYLLGSMLLFNPQPDMSQIYAFPHDGRVRRMGRSATIAPLMIIASSHSRSALSQLETFTMTRLRETARPLDIAGHTQILGSDESVEALKRYDRKRPGYLGDKDLVALYAQEILIDLSAIGIQLQAKNRDLWDTYDRHTAEAQFRFGIIPPLTFTILLVTFQSESPWWVLLLYVPIYLFILGWRQSAQATLTLVQAVVLKMVEPPVLERLREHVARLDAKDQQAAEQRKAEQARPGSDKKRFG